MDILAGDQKYWSYLKKNIRYRLREASFQRIYTSLILSKDEVKKVMNVSYLKDRVITFGTNEGEKFILNDLSIGILKNYAKHKMNEGMQPRELFSMDPIFYTDEDGVFTSEFVFDFEVVGERDAALDAQVISRAYKILTDMGLKDYIELKINNIGGSDSRKKIDTELCNYYFDKLRTLPEKYKKMFDEGKYLGLLSGDDEDLEILSKMAPKPKDYVSEDDKKYYEVLREYLTEMRVPFVEDFCYVDTRLMYTGPLFCFAEKGTKNALVKGGRYDDSLGDFTDISAPACGAVGNMNKIVDLLKRSNIDVPFKDKIQVYVAQLGLRAKKKSLSLLEDLRDTGIHTMGSIGKSTIKSQLELAAFYKADYCLLLGDQEVIDGAIILKDLKKGSQETVPYKNILKRVVDKIGKNNITHYRDIIDE